MTPNETITAIQSIGLELTANGDRLHLSAGLAAPSLELRQAIRDNKAALLVLLSASTPEPAPVTPPAAVVIHPPSNAACDGCGLRGRILSAGRYFCARLGTWGHRRGCSEPGDLLGDPSSMTAADQESVAFATVAFGQDGDDQLAGPAVPPVKCCDCHHADSLGQGDATSGLLLCKAGGRSDWGMKSHSCFRFEKRNGGTVSPNDGTAPDCQ